MRVLSTDHTTELAIETVRRARADSLRRIENFQQRLATDPAGAFEWGQVALEHACRMRAADIILSILEARGLDAARESAAARVLSDARFPASSTSVLSNLVARVTTAAFAAFAEDGAL